MSLTHRAARWFRRRLRRLQESERRFETRLPAWRLGIVAIALLGTGLASAGVAMYADRMEQALRDATAQTLRDYAAYASRIVGSELLRRGQLRRSMLMSPVTALSAGRGPLIPLDTLIARTEKVIARTGNSVGQPRGYLFMDLRTGREEARGVGTDPRVRAAVRDSIRGAIELNRAGWTAAALDFTANDKPYEADAAVVTDAKHAPRAVYAVFYDRRDEDGIDAARIFRDMAIQPPSLGGEQFREYALYEQAAHDMGNDSLLSVRVLSLDGLLVYATPRQYQSSYGGTFEVRGRFSGFVVQTTLRPHVAERVLPAAVELWRSASATGMRVLVALLVLLSISALSRELIVMRARRRELVNVQARQESLSRVSHELRTPLTVISMFSETLLARAAWGAQAPAQRHAIEVIHREAKRLSRLVENLLLHSRAQLPDMSLSIAETDVSQMVRELAVEYEPLLATHRATLLLQVTPQVRALVDPNGMRQVVMNLLDNALKYGPEGQTITLSLETPELGALMLAVADQGAGVRPQDRERIWRPYTRATSAGGVSGGSGLGLSVVREIIGRHGGEVWVEDALGGGSRFVMRLRAEGPVMTTQELPVPGREIVGSGR
jgi:signal transduction histidine kinase